MPAQRSRRRRTAALLFAIALLGCRCASADHADPSVLLGATAASASAFDVAAGRVRWTDVMPYVVIGIFVIVIALVISGI